MPGTTFGTTGFVREQVLITFVRKNVMSTCSLTKPVVPKVVPGIWEQRSVELGQHQAVLVVPVVRLTVSPIEPFNGLVLMLPGPFTLVVVRVMTALGFGTKPELFSLTDFCNLQKFCLQPIVDTRMVKLSNPSIVEGAKNVGVVSGHRFTFAEVKTPTTRSILF